MNEIAVMAWALSVLAFLALLEFLGLRQPIRDSIPVAWRFLRAKWAALRSEVRNRLNRVLLWWINACEAFEAAFVRWANRQVYRGPSINAEDIESVEYDRFCDPDFADEDGWCWHGDQAHPVEEPLDGIAPHRHAPSTSWGPPPEPDYTMDEEAREWLNAPMGPLREKPKAKPRKPAKPRKRPRKS